MLSAASAEIGAAAYVDTFSTRLGQRTAREKLAAHDGDSLARLFFECTAFAPEAFFLRQFGHRFAAHVEASPPWLFEPAAQFLIWRCESVNTHSVLLRDSVVGSLLLVAKDDENSSLSLGTAVDSHRMGLVSTAIHRFYCRLLVQSMASLLTRRRTLAAVAIAALAWLVYGVVALVWSLARVLVWTATCQWIAR